MSARIRKENAKRLRQHRLSLGMTQLHLAGVLGVAPSTVSRWEAGQRRIPQMAFWMLRKLEKEQVDNGNTQEVVSGNRR